MSLDPDFSQLSLAGLSIRLVQTEAELRRAQELRYRVFYEELGAHAHGDVRAQQRDFDSFDDYADHLLVLNDSDEIVGTYRIIRGSVLQGKPFYSESEFDIAHLKASYPSLMEMGRSCVAASYRMRHVLDALWRGIAIYVYHHDIDVIFGCASFTSANIAQHRLGLSYLHRSRLASDAFRVRALPHRYVAMEQLDGQEINERDAIRSLPPLIRGYLQVGAVFGDGAVIDQMFNTVDVCVILARANVTAKYLSHYARYDQ